jgi:uncharacterized protein (DUF2141 family)
VRSSDRGPAPAQRKTGLFVPFTKRWGGLCAPRFSVAIAFCVRAATLFYIMCAATLNVRAKSLSQREAQGCTLRVHVDNLRNANGVVGVLLFTSPGGWPEDVSKSFRHEAVPLTDGPRQAMVEFDGIPPNDYGIVALHDENKNMKLDKNIFGIPKEGFGFANNPHVGFGPPGFRQALVHVGCPATATEIHIVYK